MATMIMNATAGLPDLTGMTTLMTEALGTDMLNLSTHTPDTLNVTSSVNATTLPEYMTNMHTKRIVVIFTNLFVLLAIVFTCVLAFKHNQWDAKMRRRLKLHDDQPFGYEPIDVKEKGDVGCAATAEEEGEEEDKVVFEI